LWGGRFRRGQNAEGAVVADQLLAELDMDQRLHIACVQLLRHDGLDQRSSAPFYDLDDRRREAADLHRRPDRHDGLGQSDQLDRNRLAARLLLRTDD
jgi:hypothetical protein